MQKGSGLRSVCMNMLESEGCWEPEIDARSGAHRDAANALDSHNDLGHRAHVLGASVRIVALWVGLGRLGVDTRLGAHRNAASIPNLLAG